MMRRAAWALVWLVAGCGGGEDGVARAPDGGRCTERAYQAGQACAGEWSCDTGARDGCDNTPETFTCTAGRIVVRVVGCNRGPIDAGAADGG